MLCWAIVVEIGRFGLVLWWIFFISIIKYVYVFNHFYASILISVVSHAAAITGSSIIRIFFHFNAPK